MITHLSSRRVDNPVAAPRLCAVGVAAGRLLSVVTFFARLPGAVGEHIGAAGDAIIPVRPHHRHLPTDCNGMAKQVSGRPVRSRELAYTIWRSVRWLKRRPLLRSDNSVPARPGLAREARDGTIPAGLQRRAVAGAPVTAQRVSVITSFAAIHHTVAAQRPRPGA